MKKNILVFILIFIFILIVIFSGNLIRKVVIIEKIKKGQLNRPEFFYGSSKEIDTEYWLYKDGLKMRRDKNIIEIQVDGKEYCLNNEEKEYAIIEEKDDFFEMINFREESYLPEYDKLNNSSWKMALSYGIKTKVIDNKKCYEITYKVKDSSNNYTNIVYIDSKTYNLVEKDYFEDNNENNYKVTFNWEDLDDTKTPSIEELLEGYTEVTRDEFLNYL